MSAGPCSHVLLCHFGDAMVFPSGPVYAGHCPGCGVSSLVSSVGMAQSQFLPPLFPSFVTPSPSPSAGRTSLCLMRCPVAWARSSTSRAPSVQSVWWRIAGAGVRCGGVLSSPAVMG